MPDWLREWGTLIIALYGAGAASWSLAINWANRRDAVRKEAKAREAAEPWAELLMRWDSHELSVRAIFHNPSARRFEIAKLQIETPEEWILIGYESPRVIDPVNPGAPPKVVVSGRSVEAPIIVEAAELGAAPHVQHFDFHVGPNRESHSRRSNPQTAAAVAIRFTGSWISAKREPIDLIARAVMPA